MKIETKYNVGDKFWSYHDGKATEFTVNRIYAFVDTETKINYNSKELPSICSDFKEPLMFNSRQELIDSL